MSRDIFEMRKFYCKNNKCLWVERFYS